jgi:murein DD-endopeptidase MepM/ murein hydrolase activator NlpD
VEFLKNLKQKSRTYYRFVVMNDATFTEKVRLRFTPLSIFVVLVLSVLLLILFTTAFIAFTPLREYIPGYGSLEDNQQIRLLASKVDSLQRTLKDISVYEENIKNLLLGKNFSDDTATLPETGQPVKAEFIQTQYDSILLEMNMDYAAQHPAESQKVTRKSSPVVSSVFFAPVQGAMTKAYTSEHKSIDFTATQQTSVFSSLQGVVACAAENPSDGSLLLIIQHPNNILSMYRLKGMPSVVVGELVKTGQSIAATSRNQVVNYELWVNGASVNPLDYISF